MAGVSDAILATAGISKTYRRGPELVRAVDDVTVGFRAGRVTLVVGPSGSGKTTLLNLLAGWERADDGAVLWGGKVADPARLTWAELAMAPQRLGLLPELSIEENVGLADRIRGTTGRAPEILEAMGLADSRDALPAELSMGQQQRVAVARALAAAPRVLLADEPTSSQDESSARLVLEMLRRGARSGTACIVASHDPVAPEFADEMVTLRDGRVLG